MTLNGDNQRRITWIGKKKRIRDSNLVIIDNLLFMEIDSLGSQSILSFENDRMTILPSFKSIKGPNEWSELLGDPGITTAILDRLLHRAEIIHFRNDDSYRMKHRSSIFMEKVSKINEQKVSIFT